MEVKKVEGRAEEMKGGRAVVAVAAWATLSCLLAVVITAAVGIRTSTTELSAQVNLPVPAFVSFLQNPSPHRTSTFLHYKHVDAIPQCAGKQARSHCPGCARGTRQLFPQAVACNQEASGGGQGGKEATHVGSSS